MIKVNYFAKLFLSFIVTSVIPLLFVGGIAYGFLTHTLEDSFSRQAEKTVAKISENIDILNSEYGEIVIGLIREDELVRNSLLYHHITDIGAIRRKLEVYAGRRNAAIYIVNTQGTLAISTHPTPDLYNPQLTHEPELFRKADALKNGYVIYPYNYTNSTGDSVAYIIARAVRDERGRPVGYILVEIFKNHIEEICNNINTNLNLDLMLLDSHFFTLTNIRFPKYDGTYYRFPYREKMQRSGSGYFIGTAGRERYLWAYHTSAYSQLITVGTLPINLILENSNYIQIFTFWSCFGVLVICLILAVLFTRSMSHPIQLLVEAMKRVEGGDLSARVELHRSDELGILGRSFNSMTIRFKELIDNVMEKQHQLRRSELRALQAQINPHFLYNTLDSIKWLAKLNHVPEIANIATQLGKLLRSSISCEDDLITVEESLDGIQSYLEIQKIRYNDKFETVIHVNADLYPYRIPKLILQPIVENAIIHGLEDKVGQGHMVINGYLKDRTLVFEVVDDGVGIVPEKMADIRAGLDLSTSKHSIGIDNVNRRIKLYYGEEYGLDVQSEPGRGTKVTLRMPAVLDTKEWEKTREADHA